MKTLLAVPFLSILAAATTAHADTTEPCDDTIDPCAKAPIPGPAVPGTAKQDATSDTSSSASKKEADDGWHAPAGKRFTSGFRLGWMYLNGITNPNMSRPNGESMAQQYGLKSPNMFLLGYEGFYRIIGHSWLNVLMVGNVSIAGLEQSKFLPSASGLLGFEFDRSFQVGVGVNVTPDAAAISHMVVAAGWTPMIGSIQTPIHGFFMPDADGNYRVGATVGMNW